MPTIGCVAAAIIVNRKTHTKNTIYATTIEAVNKID